MKNKIALVIALIVMSVSIHGQQTVAPTDLDLLLQQIDALKVKADAIRKTTPPVVTPPAPTADITLGPTGNLQAALDAVVGGGTIYLAPGATYSGNFALVAKPSASPTAKITIRTKLDPGLLAYDARMTPAAAARLNLAKITCSTNCLSPALWFGPGAHDYVIAGVEIIASTTVIDREPIWLGINKDGIIYKTLDEQATNITLDQLYVHADKGGHHGCYCDGRNIRVTHGWWSGFLERGRDSQAIGIIQGAGPYLIEDNYLEASGENIMYGGSDPAVIGLIPSDITIRHNHMFKPLDWKTQTGSVKNLFELKNARRVVVEGNVLENVWTDGQAGSAILFTVRNQNGACPTCNIDDVLFQNNIVRNVTGFGVQVLGTDNNNPSGIANKLRILNNLFENIGGGGMNVTGPITGLEYSHNTVVGTGAKFVGIGSNAVPPTGSIKGLVMLNNVARGGAYGLTGDNTGLGILALDAFAAPYQFAGNVIEGTTERTIKYPTGNTVVPAGQLNPSLDAANAYQYKGTVVGTDGLPPGVDSVALLKATAGAVVSATSAQLPK